MRIAIYTKQASEETISQVIKIVSLLDKMKVEVLLCKDIFEKTEKKITTLAEKFLTINDLILKADFLISLGGDGTFLDTILYVKDSGIPVIGFNTGRLGFLASIGEENFSEAIDDLAKGHFSIEKRSMLMLESSTNLFNENNIALNDFVLHKKDSSSMIIVHTYLNGEFLNTYWADGIIVSTPTGSTGYSLSCGGPIIFPSSSSFVITPISPHNLNVRPVVVDDNSVISFEVECRTNNFLTALDSRSESAETLTQLAVRKCPYVLHTVKLSDSNHLETLRKKLNWGLDKRNF